MLLATFLEATLGGPKFVHRVLSHLRSHCLEIVTVCQGAPWDCMLASKWTCEKRYLHCPLLVQWLVGLLEVLLVCLLEILLDCCILLDVAKTLVTSTYNILVGLKSTVSIRSLFITIFILQEVELFQF